MMCVSDLISTPRVRRNVPGLLARAAILLASVLTTGSLPESARAGEDPTVAGAQSASTARPMTAEDLFAMQRVGAPTVSPDGTLCVFPVTRYHPGGGDGPNTDLWLVPTDGSKPPRQLTFQPGADTAPVFSPDGASILFSSKRGEGPAQLCLLPLRGGEATRLTDLPVAPQSAVFSKDGRKVYFAASTWPDLNDDFAAVRARIDAGKDAGKDAVRVHVSEARSVRYWDHYLTDGQVTHLFMLDVASGYLRDLLPGSARFLGFDDADFAVSPDGRSIAFSANVTDPPYRSLNFDVLLLDIATGMVDDLTSQNPAADRGPVFRPDGKKLLYARGKRPEIDPDFDRLVELDLESGRAEEWPLDLGSSPDGYVYSRDGSTVFLQAQRDGRQNLYAVIGGELSTIARGGVISGAAPGADGQVVFARQSLLAPPELFRVDLRESGDTKLTGFNDALLARLDLGTTEDARFPGADGDEIQMWICYPPGFDPKKKWPLVQMIHGGPHGAFQDSFHFRWNQALFAAPGYVVVAVNFHGSTGFGQEFAESILGDHARRPFEDIEKATDHMLARGFIDAQRMAAAGGSYGGYMVAWILGHTDRYACLINHAGVYDLMAQFASDATWGRANNYGAAPFKDPARIDRNSPSRFAANFNTPTLILHGEKDYRVPYTQGLNLHGVLTAKGVPSRLVVYPEENHWILKSNNAIHWWGEVHNWLNRHLTTDR